MKYLDKPKFLIDKMEQLSIKTGNRKRAIKYAKTQPNLFNVDKFGNISIKVKA